MLADSYTVVYHPNYVELGLLLTAIVAVLWLATRWYLRR